jgi:nitroimidazol reductase NimA-like FMN-containing flavoprotein (pyridoxamine 5'-phosphate oxidase superfamily)
MSEDPVPGGRRVALRRHPERGRHDRPTIDAILDASPYCHLGFVVDGQPYVIATIHARDGDTVYVHGSSVSRMLRTLRGGIPMCLTVTLLDGLVLARSAFNHSMNYRSVVVLGTAREVTDREEKNAALRAVVEHVLEGRWDHVRWPTDQELKATSVLALPLDESSAKIRTGPPKDDEEDLDYPVWAGVLPLRVVAGTPVPDPKLPASMPVPDHVTDHGRDR